MKTNIFLNISSHWIVLRELILGEAEDEVLVPGEPHVMDVNLAPCISWEKFFKSMLINVIYLKFLRNINLNITDEIA